METRQDGSPVIPEAQSASRRPSPTPPAVRTDSAGALAELAHAVGRDLATPDLAATTERAYARDW